MLNACDNVTRMTRMIQIRNVPEEIHRALKVRAARLGMSLSDYLLAEVAEIAERPTLEEMLERLRAREPVRGLESSAEVIRRHRDRS
jgi:plasmid stability protein